MTPDDRLRLSLRWSRSSSARSARSLLLIMFAGRRFPQPIVSAGRIVLLRRGPRRLGPLFGESAGFQLGQQALDAITGNREAAVLTREHGDTERLPIQVDDRPTTLVQRQGQVVFEQRREL